MIRFRNRRTYKYSLADDHSQATGIEPPQAVSTAYLHLDATGNLTIKQGYAWDGATSFPDFGWILRASLVHDAFYQLLRDEQLPLAYRDATDRLFSQIIVEAGGPRWLAWIAYHTLRLFGERHARPDIRSAP